MPGLLVNSNNSGANSSGRPSVRTKIQDAVFAANQRGILKRSPLQNAIKHTAAIVTLPDKPSLLAQSHKIV
jgi:hypothetical protein